MNNKLDREKIINLKNKKIKNNKTFFNKEVEAILDKESKNDIININSSLSIHESGSKLKTNRSYLLNGNSNEESLCNIINTIYKKKLFIVKMIQKIIIVRILKIFRILIQIKKI